MTLGPTHKYDQPGLGVSVRYEAREPVYVRADVYIFDLGRNDIGHGAKSEAVKAAFDGARADIVNMEKAGHYRDVKPQQQKPVSLTVGGKPLPMLAATYEFVILPGPGASGGEIGAVSHLLVTGYMGKFLKVRFTYPKTAKDKCAEMLKGFLAALGGVLK